MSITQELAKQIVNAKFEDIPTQAVERIKRGILDDIGIGFLGYHMDPRIPALIELAKEIGRGTEESTLIGDGEKISCVFASGVNAQMSSGTDFNETGPGSHALSNLVQTGIAIADRTNASGKDLITAVCLAYDINGRFARAAFPLDLIHGTLPKRDISFPGHSKHYAATAAITASKLLNLDEKQVNEAIGIAWYFSPQPTSTGMYGWSIFNLGACDWGIQAALLAQKGFEGPHGFIEIEGRHDEAAMLSSPSPYYYPEKELQLKLWIASRGTHPGISATVDIIKEEGIKVEDIEEIRFKAKRFYFQHPFSVTEPTNYWEAVNSIVWAFAMTILGYEPGPDWLTPERLKDPIAQALAKKIRVQELERATEIWDSGVRYSNDGPNEVEVVAKGKVYKKLRTYGEAPGSSLNPMPKERLERKFKVNTVPVIGEKQSAELFSMLDGLDDQKTIRSVTNLFSPR
jgi:2-methylcitrate dehydratase PrpD